MGNQTKTLDEEKAEKKGYGGVSAKDITDMAQRTKGIKEKMSKLAADLGADFTKFEEKGGNKKALKAATMIANMEIENSADFMYHLEAYLDVLGFYDQRDLFEQERENRLKADSVAAASKPTKAAQPSVN